MQMRIPANEYSYPGFPRPPDRLPRAFVIPAIDQDSVILLLAKNSPNFRCIETCKPAVPRRVRNIFEEGMWVARQEIHVPIKLHAEASAGLFLRRRLVTEVHMHIQIGMRRHSPEPRRMVLDGVRT